MADFDLLINGYLFESPSCTGGQNTMMPYISKPINSNIFKTMNELEIVLKLTPGADGDKSGNSKEVSEVDIIELEFTFEPKFDGPDILVNDPLLDFGMGQDARLSQRKGQALLNVHDNSMVSEDVQNKSMALEFQKKSDEKRMTANDSK